MPKPTLMIPGLLILGTMSVAVLRAQQPPARDNQTLLKINFAGGRVTAFVNNNNVGTYGPTGSTDPNRNKMLFVDVSKFAHVGSNTLRLSWNETQTLAGQVQVDYAALSNRFRTLARVSLGRRDPLRGQRDVTFTLPEASRVVGQVPDDIKQPVSAGPTIPTYDRQTVLDISLTTGGATVVVNGAQVGSYGSSSLGRTDISRFVHPGQNSIRVQRTGNGTLQGLLKITYAPVKDRFMIQRTMNWTGKNANKTVDEGTFTLPTTAGSR